MFTFRNFSMCAALVSMVALSMTGCRGAAAQGVGHSCATCGGSGQAYSSQPTFAQPYSSSVPTSAGSGTQSFGGQPTFAPQQNFGGGSGTQSFGGQPSFQPQQSFQQPSFQQPSFGGGSGTQSFGGGSGSR